MKIPMSKETYTFNEDKIKKEQKERKNQDDKKEFETYMKILAKR